MKIGTLTFHITSNYGALLQAYALQVVLNRMGHSSEVINYQFPGSENLLCQKLSDCRTFRRKIQLLRGFVWCLAGPVGYGQRLRIARSIDFIKNYIPVSEYVYGSYPDLKKEATAYDVYITGSDQVWNPTLKETSDEAYLLEFVPGGRSKISYAASFGVPELPQDQLELYGRALQKFNHISVREQEGVEIVRKVTDGKDAQLVLDPTMLLTREQWLDLAVYKPKHKEYILCYFLDDFDQSRQFVNDLQVHYGMPVLYIGFNKKYLFDSKIELISEAGPREFLGLYANASHVVTNSFHGTVFSLLFRKSFYSMLGSNPHRKSMNGRLYNLANMLNMERRICEVSSMVRCDQPLDYGKINLVLDSEREKSLAFIRKALKQRQ